MQEATLCYVIDGEAVLLIEKRRGLGSGLYNAPGGKVEADETPLEAARREVREEVGLEVSTPRKVGELTFTHDGHRRQFVHVFRTTDYDGDPRPSPEAVPKWFDRSELPYDEMWEDDRLWLPLVLEGRPFAGKFAFEGGRSLDEATFVDHELDLDPDFAERIGRG